MNDDIFEEVKELLRANKHLFAKLHRVGEDYRAIDFDENGLYEEEEATASRHWSKLAAKLTEALDSELQECSVSLPERYDPGQFRISFEIKPQEGGTLPSQCGLFG